MKYLFFILSTILLLVSCTCPCAAGGNNAQKADSLKLEAAKLKQQAVQQSNTLKADFKKQVSHNKFDNCDITEFSYKGHNYIWFAKSRIEYNKRGFGFAGVVHDPDCPCNK